MCAGVVVAAERGGWGRWKHLRTVPAKRSVVPGRRPSPMSVDTVSMVARGSRETVLMVARGSRETVRDLVALSAGVECDQLFRFS
jgi:hypothetical protein